jgi:glyoxylate reductase
MAGKNYFMSTTRPLLYVSRLLPHPVMALVHERFQLVHEPTETTPTPAALRDGLSRADAAICTLTDPVDADLLSSASHLKILANYAVGYNNIDLDAARRCKIVVANTPDVLTDTTADLTWALLLATARRVIEGDALVRSHRWTGWTPTQLLGTEVSGKTLGVVGMGRIGRAVARRAEGFRMVIRYHSHRSLPTVPDTWEPRPLDALLQESDFVTLHIPLNAETRHLVGARELSLMRPTAILINTSRGPIIDEAALVHALQSGTIAGAGLDVYEEEPVIHPVLPSLKQVVLLPHLGSATMQTRIQMGLICLENIQAVLEGRPAPNRVD